MRDPFSPEADPSPPKPRVTRRELLVLAPAAALLSGCVTPRRLACAPKPEDSHSCQHRFCRYYRDPERASD